MEVTSENIPEVLSILLTKLNHLTAIAEQNNKLLNQSRGVGFFSKEDLKELFYITNTALKFLVSSGKINEYMIGKRPLYKVSEIYDAIQIAKKEKEVPNG